MRLPGRLLLTLACAAPLLAQTNFNGYPNLPAEAGSITVADRQGRPVGRILPQKRYWVTLDRVPEFLRQALLAVEDARFYEHGGIDLRGIARAFVTDVTKGRMAEGGSTITQQLIKNKYLSGERSLDRKVKEAKLAVEFEKHYSKNQILEMYFNEIYYGNGAYGIAQAARLYFDKTPEQLSPAECIALAGVPKNPSAYNPLGKPAEVAKRREVVLARMAELKLIDPRFRLDLRAHPAKAQGPGRTGAYLAFLRAQLVERFGAERVEQGGLEVQAALDLDLQRQAEEALHAGVAKLTPGMQGALVCMDPASGDLLAAVGGADGQENGYNRAFLARRQPGSAIKPILYAAAMEQGIPVASRWDDAPVAYDKGNGGVWKPQNYEGERLGELTLAEALAHSSNVVAVKLLDRVTVPAFTAFAGRLGLALHAQNGLSLALGTEEVTLKELVQAYASLASGGLRPEARAILKVHDRRSGAWTEVAPAATPVLAPADAFLTTSMMRDVFAYGTAKAFRGFAAERPMAGKTGTTESHQDAWFVGFTPQLVTGVWVGFDRPRPGGRGFTGATAAAPVWARFMQRALAGREPAPFPVPETVHEVEIDPETGALATPACPDRKTFWYKAGTEPGETCPRHPVPPAAAPAT